MVEEKIEQWDEVGVKVEEVVEEMEVEVEVMVVKMGVVMVLMVEVMVLSPCDSCCMLQLFQIQMWRLKLRFRSPSKGRRVEMFEVLIWRIFCICLENILESEILYFGNFWCISDLL